ncbi:hypothetical protein [Amycolatopsis sp. NPDC051372]
MCAQLASPRARGLFDKAIVQSRPLRQFLRVHSACSGSRRRHGGQTWL